ncbi:homocysteine S-methyltransferase [Actinomadura alba]|uniref:Homocysteine S-methyltransferase n=1 Tax=Actinomadura alba TaxID=406431 RepID=A0ABR7LJL9_9ACTN|nr:homocysteine S-methyltransferase [Actinomadura alba]MBC6465047.1 homocysteine S-methyltransferase [Actinomadura alba]
MSRTSLGQAISREVVVLDGGLATRLEAQGHDLSGGLWSARLLADAPEAIVEAHLSFFRAGARVATTASYQATFEGFAASGLGAADTARLLRRSVTLAAKARDRHAAETGDASLWVAASAGPYGAMLADGSEYRGRYGLSVAELTRFHRPRLEVLAEAGADVLALETVPDLDEAEALLAALDGLGVPAWLSFTVDGDRTRAGQPLTEAFAAARDAAALIAVGVNCCAPADVTGAVRTARAITGKPVIAYPNSGEHWDATARAWTGTSGFDPAPVDDWVAAGARLIGGCCRVGPADIANIAGRLRPA